MNRGEVHLVELDLTVRGLDGELDAGERERAARFVFDRDRERFVAAHGLLRRALGLFLGRAPAQLRFEVAALGKPFLVGEPLQFNLSHSADRALVAVCAAQPIGVDVEWMRPEVEFRQIAARMFSPREQATLAPLSDDALPAAFYRVWTLKESFIKALGEGLSHALDGFDVNAGVEGWTLRELTVEPGYAAALTIQGELSGVRRWRAGADGIRACGDDGAAAPPRRSAASSTPSPSHRR